MLVEPILEGVGHGDELGAGVGGEGLLGRAAASAAAADQADLDRAAAGGMDQGNGQAGGDRRRGGCPRQRGGRARQEIASRWLNEDEEGRDGWGWSVTAGAPVEGSMTPVDYIPFGPAGRM